ncbi:MAG: tyrosine-type recombinase/integrase [Methanoregula sp.]|nr:tyrosine-type recombinase/integrase [Methanoregula sp.]
MARIASFLGQYSVSSTRSSYYSGVIAFLSFTYGFTRKGKRVSEKEKEKFEDFADRYFREKRDYLADLIHFGNTCEKLYAPTTSSYYLNAVKELMLYNNVELTRKQEKNLRNKISSGGPISEEDDLTKEKIRQILNVADLKLKTLIMLIVSSGLRLGEALNLTLDDVKIHDTYGIISLKGRKKNGTGTKNVHSRTTFINKEAVELLKQWLAIREKYTDYIIGRSRGRFRVKTSKDDARIFTFGKNNAENILKTALYKSGLMRKDQDTGRSTIHFHLFRKYFVTNLGYSGIPEFYIKFFTGHLSTLERTYNRPVLEKMLEIYLKGEPYLRIYDDNVEEIVKTKEEMKNIREKTQDIHIENIELKQKLMEIRSENQTLREEFQQWKNTMTEELIKRFKVVDKVDEISGIKNIPRLQAPREPSPVAPKKSPSLISPEQLANITIGNDDEKITIREKSPKKRTIFTTR